MLLKCTCVQSNPLKHWRATMNYIKNDKEWFLLLLQKFSINNSSGRGVAFRDHFFFIIKVLTGLILNRSCVGNYIYFELVGEKITLYSENSIWQTFSLSYSFYILSATFCWMFPFPWGKRLIEMSNVWLSSHCSLFLAVWSALNLCTKHCLLCKETSLVKTESSTNLCTLLGGKFKEIFPS